MTIGTISSFGPIPIQVVYQCDHCGYTKVIEVKC